MADVDPSLRKAAVLLASVDRATAKAILHHLNPADVAKLQHIVESIGTIEDSECLAVFEELRKGGLPSPISHEDADTYGPAWPRGGSGVSTALNSDAAAKPGQPFQFLEDAEQILPFLEGEHPQTVALVLSHVAPKRAAQLLSELPAAMRSDVVLRMAELGATDSDVVRAVATGLESRMAQHLAQSRKRAKTRDSMERIMEHADQHLSSELRQIMEPVAARPPSRHTGETQKTKPRLSAPREPTNERTQLSAAAAPMGSISAASRRLEKSVSASSSTGTTPSLAEAPSGPSPVPGVSASPSQTRPKGQRASSKSTTAALGPPRVEFSELAALADDVLIQVFSQVNEEVALLALAGAPEGMLHSILKRLPGHEAKWLRQSLLQLGPLRLVDIDRAQAEVANAALTLHEQGAIQWPARRRAA